MCYILVYNIYIYIFYLKHTLIFKLWISITKQNKCVSSYRQVLNGNVVFIHGRKIHLNFDGTPKCILWPILNKLQVYHNGDDIVSS